MLPSGQFRQTLIALHRGLQRARRATHDLARQVTAPLQLALISAFVEAGYLVEAAKELRAAEKLCQGSDHPAHLVRWLELDGQLGLLHGEYTRSKQRAVAVRTRCAAQDLPQAALRACLSKAMVLLIINQTSEATQAIDMAEELASGLSDKQVLLRITLMRQLAHARGQSLADTVTIAPTVTELWSLAPLGQQQSPSPNHLPDLPQSAQYLTFFSDRALAFQWRLAHHGIEEAARYLQRMIDSFEGTELNADSAPLARAAWRSWHARPSSSTHRSSPSIPCHHLGCRSETPG